MHFDSEFSGQFGPGPGFNAGDEDEMPGFPPFAVVQHPSAPPQLPFAIKDNVNGGYLTGSSPLFPRVYATPTEAQAAIQEHLQTGLGRPNGPIPLTLPSGAQATPAAVVSKGFGQNNQPALRILTEQKTANGNTGLPQPATTANISLAARGLPKPGSPLLPVGGNNSQLGSNKTAPTPGPGTHQPPSYYDSKLNEFAKSLGTRWSEKDPLYHMTSAEILQYRALKTQRDQAYLDDTHNSLLALLTTRDTSGQVIVRKPVDLTGAQAKEYQKLLKRRTYLKANVALDQFIGTMPGNSPGTKNCAIGAQQFLWALGVPWEKVPHSESAGTMRSLVSSRKNDWRSIKQSDLSPGDLIFVPVTGGSGYHVAVYVGPGNLAFQADSGLGFPRKYMELAKYRPYYPDTKRGNAAVEFYHYAGTLKDRSSGEPHPWQSLPWNGYNRQK
ncbi:MAG TPA: hypothetical protein VFW40_13045 [Capsulimonadaceae bacterium]|nr:hypothetical protein [Capsulimonadaceae bacterium]